MITLATDITEHKVVEERLRQAQKMEAVGQLTGGVAHDFNNLLAVILGNIELVADRLGTDDKQVRAIVHAATRGAELTQRLLSFSRQQALRPETVDLNACVTGMTDMLRRTLGETIEIEPIIASGLSISEVDPGQLENALLNLAVNARDAMPKGGRLTIETANIELDHDYAAALGDVTPGHYVRLSVTDTGIGIPPEIIEHVFEPFFTTKEVGEGSGLGLSMVYGFVKQSGGHVTISSEPGCGTTVQLYLPQAEVPVQPAGQEPVMGDTEARGETVLVVEDDPDVRSLVISLLQRFGYNVLEAGDGAEALAALQDYSRIDLLLSDVVLPGGVSGSDLAEQVTDRYPGIKVLFMSGYPDAPHRRGPLVENTELLGKPFGKRDLAQKVRAVLNG
jgi:nitrogen-specific signal transduction histidine kinase/CheY-like chemotaxis protein